MQGNHVPESTSTPSLLRRMASWLYEGLLLYGVVFVADYLFSTLSQTRHALDNRHAQQAFLFVIFGIYFTWFWSKGQTLAMKTWHIKIVDVEGRPITQAQALKRYLLSWVWFLPPLMVAWWTEIGALKASALIGGWVVLWAMLSRLHAQRQFWHDVWSGTRLTSTQLPKRSPQ